MSRSSSRCKRRRRGTPNMEEPIDVEEYHAARQPTCIDLTADDMPDLPAFIDLTSPSATVPSLVNDTPVVLIEAIDPPRRRRRGRRRRRRVAVNAENAETGENSANESNSDDGELPVIPFDIPQPTLGSNSCSTSQYNPADAGPSPKRRSIQCPICLDEERTIKNTGRQIHSTVCGHIFCNVCIKSAIQTQKRCPSCRKKLTNKQVHQIFI